MKNYQKKTNFKHFLQSWPMLLILTFLCIFIASGVIGLLGGFRDTLKNKNIAEEKMLELETRKVRLVKDLANLETDEGKEKIFRENYGLAKEGEEVIIVDEKIPPEVLDDKKGKGFFGFLNIFKSKRD